MYLIKPVDENYKLDNTVSHELGYISIVWKNYLGDPGLLKIGPFQSNQLLVPTKQEPTKVPILPKMDIEV